MLLGFGLLLLIYLPITIAAMFIAAPLVDVTFGEFGPAVVKIAGICVFTFAIQDVTATMAHPGWAGSSAWARRWRCSARRSN